MGRKLSNSEAQFTFRRMLNVHSPNSDKILAVCSLWVTWAVRYKNVLMAFQLRLSCPLLTFSSCLDQSWNRPSTHTSLPTLASKRVPDSPGGPTIIPIPVDGPINITYGIFSFNSSNTFHGASCWLITPDQQDGKATWIYGPIQSRKHQHCCRPEGDPSLWSPGSKSRNTYTLVEPPLPTTPSLTGANWGVGVPDAETSLL